MDYTEDILKILSTELVPYTTGDGQACIDGVLTSAHKLNEFIQQLLQQTPCTTQLLPPDKIWLLKEIAHPYIYETAEEGTYSIATQGIEKILESYERLRQQLS